MAKFRKKPVVIEAVQFSPNVRPWPEGVELHEPPPGVIVSRTDGSRTEMRQQPYPAIHTLEGWMRVRPGDWVITGVAGEKYPCKPDIFEATYEIVAEGHHAD